VLFNEPKLLKSFDTSPPGTVYGAVSVLFNEPKLLKSSKTNVIPNSTAVSVLFNEPKLLKSGSARQRCVVYHRFQCSSTSRNC